MGGRTGEVRGAGEGGRGGEGQGEGRGMMKIKFSNRKTKLNK